MRWRNRDGVIELCFQNTDLLQEYNKQRRAKEIVQTVLVLVWLAAVIVFAVLGGDIEESGDILEFLPVLCLIGGIMLVMTVCEVLFAIRRNQLFNRSLQSLPVNEEGNLRRGLILNYKKYDKILIPIAVCGVALVAGLVILLAYLNETIWMEVGVLGGIIIVFLLIFVLSRGILRERMNIVRAIEQLRYNPYNNSDLYNK